MSTPEQRKKERERKALWRATKETPEMRARQNKSNKKRMKKWRAENHEEYLIMNRKHSQTFQNKHKCQP